MHNKFLEKFLPEISTLSLENLDKFMDFYSENCEFSDPFHLITGKDKIVKVYVNMFKNLTEPGFNELRVLSSESVLVIKWVFSFKKSPKSVTTEIPGVSCLTLSNKGLITHHEDFWDGSELFAAYFPFNLPINWAKSKVKGNL